MLGAQRPIEDLAAELARPEPAHLTRTALRSAPPTEAWARIAPLLPLVGVTRVADVSAIAAHGLPVAQTARPALYHHPLAGQNSGAQGKGRSLLEAQLAAGMESIEAYCSEPREPVLVRGARARLSTWRLLLDLETAPRCDVEPPSPLEPIVWTPASTRGGEIVWVPAELVYYPFFAEDYATRPIFPCCSNGLGAGLTTLEAAIQAAYELAERHLWAAWELGLARAIRLDAPEILRVLAPHRGELWLLRLPGGPNLPVVVCLIEEGEHIYAGSGCHLHLSRAVARATDEALQAVATFESGARDDITREGHGAAGQPPSTTVALGDLAAGPDLATLDEELTALLAAIAGLGAPEVLFSDLTRRGIDVPVIRALAPGLLPPAAARTPKRGTTAAMRAAAWGLPR